MAIGAFLVASCSDGAGPPQATTVADERTAPATLGLSDLRVGPEGIGLAMHPTRAPIVVGARSRAPLEVCAADALGRPSDPRLSSFGRRLTRCLRVPETGSVVLPRTDGNSHVGIRISTRDGSATTIRALRVDWDCADDYFLTDPRDPALQRAVRCPAILPAEERVQP